MSKTYISMVGIDCQAVRILMEKDSADAARLDPDKVGGSAIEPYLIRLVINLSSKP